jgi:isopentenyl phosphate kinase
MGKIIMTPKEKAKEIVEKYTLLVPVEFGGMHIDLAKQCALIAVDEILNHHSQEQSLYRIDTYYWQQVKKEIEKL